jgi:hypothetical protein
MAQDHGDEIITKRGQKCPRHTFLAAIPGRDCQPRLPAMDGFAFDFTGERQDPQRLLSRNAFSSVAPVGATRCGKTLRR